MGIIEKKKHIYVLDGVNRWQRVRESKIKKKAIKRHFGVDSSASVRIS